MITICKAILSGSTPSLHTGPPHHAEQTIDSDRFTRHTAETLPIAEPPAVQTAVALVRSILLDDPAP